MPDPQQEFASRYFAEPLRRLSAVFQGLQKAWACRLGVQDEEHGEAVRVRTESGVEDETCRDGSRSRFGACDRKVPGWRCELVVTADGTATATFVPLAHEGNPIRSGGEGDFVPMNAAFLREARRQLRKDRQVGVKPDPIKPTDAERQE